MKKTLTLVTLALAAAILVGCSGGDDGSAAAAGTTGSSEQSGKAGDMKGVGADQVQVTTAGSGADAATGSKSAGGN